VGQLLRQRSTRTVTARRRYSDADATPMRTWLRL